MSDEIPPRFELSFLIGEVVRNDVFAESEMRSLWWVLHRAGLVRRDEPGTFGRAIDDVLRGLKKPEVPESFRAIALDVVQPTKHQHLARNQLAHDQWIQLRWEPEQLRSMRAPRSVTLAELRACADALQYLTWRLRGVWIIAQWWLDVVPDWERDLRDDLQSWTRVAMGFIADDPSQVIGTPGPAPLPPGV
jgi:hypothetical protein